MTQSILSSFSIKGLHGYKDITIDFSGAARILIAGNGSGKTTIFNAMYAVLSGRFHRLNSLDFESIECTFARDSETVVIDKQEVGELPSDAFERIAQISSRTPGVGDEELAAFLQTDYKIGQIAEQAGSEPILRTVYSHMPGDYAAVGKILDELALQFRNSRSNKLQAAAEQVARLMSGVRVLYLPTYRRIELPLLRAQKKPQLGRYGADESVFAENSPDTQHINFGLADVEKRLNELSENVEKESNVEYRNISATILDEALANQIETSTADLVLPDIDSLRQFLSRVSGDHLELLWYLGNRSRPNAERNERRIRAIKSLYETGEIHSEGQRFLRYFLGRLGSVIEKTKLTESMLQRFVEACNQYLAESTDEKVFTYDANAMRVRVVNSWSGREILLGNLSSGEKQVVSILARLYLYDASKFVLIDEPELSLSLEWQKRILPDMMRSGSVTQLFAITHSPFIFDNELDGFAGPLITRKRKAG